MTGSIDSDPSLDAARVVRRPVDEVGTRRAQRAFWDRDAGAYQAEHGSYLGDARFMWSPEAVDEAVVGLLGPVSGRRVLEVGCGAAQCSRWLRSVGASPIAFDLSFSQLSYAAALDRRTGVSVPVVQADAVTLPFAAESFDVACSAYGAVPFVADSAAVMREVARVLRPGGRWAFSVTHPMRWCFPDDPGEPGLHAIYSYFDRTPYVEETDEGEPTYVEHHRTLGDRMRELVAAGFAVLDVVEPDWPEGHDRPWGQYSPLRGRVFPGTAIFVSELRR